MLELLWERKSLGLLFFFFLVETGYFYPASSLQHAKNLVRLTLKGESSCLSQAFSPE